MTSLKLEGATLIDNIKQIDNKVEDIHFDLKKLSDIVYSHSEKNSSLGDFQQTLKYTLWASYYLQSHQFSSGYLLP